MCEYRTNWIGITDREAIQQTTGGLLDYAKWVKEPNETAKWVRRFLPKTSSICELGCGVGRNMGILSNYFSDVFGTDLHPNIPTQSDYPLSLFPYGQVFSADGVLSTYVMQHIPPKLFPKHFEILKQSEWLYLFTLEVGNDFGYDYERELLKFTVLIESKKWPYEGHNIFAKVYLRKE